MDNRDDRLIDKGMENSGEGALKDLKGRLKDGAGGLLGDQSLQNEGKMDRLEGKLQDTLGDVQRKLGGERT